MGIWARRIPLLLAGMLPAAGVLAATPDTQAACSPLPPTSWLRDAGVTALSMQVREGRCVVEVTAVDGKALFRQQQMLMVLAQKACAAPAEATVDDTQVSLQLRLPKRCAARSSQSTQSTVRWAGQALKPRCSTPTTVSGSHSTDARS